MADIFSAAVSAANFIFDVTNSAIFNDGGAEDGGNDPEQLGLRIQDIKIKLYGVDEDHLSELQKLTFRSLLAAVLDAEDILDREETLAKKKKLKEKEGSEGTTHETNDQKEILSVLYTAFQSTANKAWESLSSWGIDEKVKIKKMLDDINKELPTIELKDPSNRDLSWESVRASGSLVGDASSIIGRDVDKMNVISLLLRSSVHKDKVSVVSIVGFGGLGKTTLAQLVYEDESWQGSYKFDLKIWVSDSKKFDMESLLKTILKFISPDNEGSIIDGLQKDKLKIRLIERIRGKRFFLVLDDVDNEEPSIWENLERLLNYGSKEESRILVTTRSRKVANDIMGSTDSTYPLTGLSEEESVQLFERYAFRGARDEHLFTIGKLIVKQCAGVPLPIRVIGSLLRSKDKRKWEDVRDLGLAKIDMERPKLMPILKMSYDDLDPILKQCFSYCSLFPKNYRIPKDTLSNIWMANVCFNTNNEKSIEDICNEKLEVLYNRCFLDKQERGDWDGDTYFKMHDLMHDLVVKVAGSEEFLVKEVAESAAGNVESKKFIIEKNVRHLGVFCLEKRAAYRFEGRGLRTWIARNYYGFHRSETLHDLNQLVSDCPVIRFLDLRRCKDEILTDSIGTLIHLRYLDLSDNEFQTLPDSITELINLRHLKLLGCNALTCLPFRMGALTSLEFLDLSHCLKLEQLPMSIEKLVKLKDLKLIHCKNLTHLPSGMGGLTSLVFLDLSHCYRLEQLPTSIEKLASLKDLKLTYCLNLTQLPSGMGGLTSLVFLYLSYCYGLEELPMNIEKLASLKDLKLRCCENLTRLFSGMGSLTSLELLDLSGCEKLEELPMGIEKLINLKDLNFEGCLGLIRMPAGMGALMPVCLPSCFIVGHPESNHTAQLEELESMSELPHGMLKIQIPNTINMRLKATTMDGAPFLSNNMWLEDLHIEWKSEENIEEVVPENHMGILAKCGLPPNLQEFRMEGYQGIMFPAWVPKESSVDVLGNLKRITMYNCSRCRRLPPVSRLPHLKYMRLERLDSLEYIEDDVSGASFCASLEELKLIFLPQLRGWCSTTSGIFDHQELLKLPPFPRLFYLYISDCPKLSVAPILVSSPAKVLSVKREETLPSFVPFFVEICRKGGEIWLQMEEEEEEPPLNVESSQVNASDKRLTKICIESHKCSDTQTMNMFVGALTELSKHLTRLEIVGFSGLKTLPERLIQHLTAIQELDIRFCDEFTVKEEEELGIGDSEKSWEGLQSLQSLTFIHLPKMEGLPQGIQLLNSLQKLYIYECDNLIVPEWLCRIFIRYGNEYTRRG